MVGVKRFERCLGEGLFFDMGSDETKKDIRVVPWTTVMVGPYPAVEYRFVDVGLLERQVADMMASWDQQAELHTDECLWWEDWLQCSCGGDPSIPPFHQTI